MRHRLELSPETTVVGFIDKALPPVLTVDSGDIVEFQTGSIGGDRVTPTTTLDELIDYLHERAPRAGAHTLTGPIAVNGAEPGQVLRVDVLALEPREHGYNFQLPLRMNKGLLAEDFPEGRLTHYRHNLETMTVDICPGVRIPLKPFLGIVAVAPDADGPHHSVPPGPHGGNMDLPEVRVGASVYLPIRTDGALFYAGDAHSTQGDGEVCTSAIETAFSSAEVRLEVVDRGPLVRPRVETDDLWITLGLHEDLLEASRQAVRDMIRLLGEEYSIGPEDAYTVCSATVDLSITQIVNGTRGVHASLPKSIFT